jgi:hypothetical protein
MPSWIIFLIIAVVIVAGIVIGLFFFGKRLEKRQNESQAQMQAAAQTVSILVIDKKRMKMKDANLPKIVLDQTPRYMRGSKVPIVKAKIGPKVMSLVSDPKVFELIPVKKEIKAVISGIYIMEVKGLRGNLEVKKEKKSIFKRLTGVLRKDK